MATEGAIQPPAARVLLVDDDAVLRRSWARFFRGTALALDSAGDGREAMTKLREAVFDVVVSDIAMPDVDGVTLLRFVREHHPGTPVILVTGSPSVETATEAVEYGAVRYLLKPVTPDHLMVAIREAVANRDAHRPLVELAEDGERAREEEQLDRALEGLWMAFQPIVSLWRREVFAYEALARTTEPTVPHPGVLFELAEKLSALHRVGRRVRQRVAEATAGLDAAVFVNLHPLDLLDDDLFSLTAPLTARAKQIVLEITERETMDRVPDLAARLKALRGFGYRIALDDLGAGYAGLASFAAMAPEVIKLDMSLTRDIPRYPVKQKLIRTITSLCETLGATVVAEGVERPEDRDALADLGCDLLQGYLFARPGRPFPSVNW